MKRLFPLFFFCVTASFGGLITGGTGGGGGGSGDALTTNPLSQFASTTSLQLAGVISNETGSGALAFATSPTFVTPVLGTPTSVTLTNGTGLPVSGITASTATALGVGSVELGHATDTTVSRLASGQVAVEGVPVQARYVIRADTTVTQANDANAHAIFTTPTNGRLTLGTGTYHFRGKLVWSSMSATSGNVKIDILGAGTATAGSWLWSTWGNDATALTTVSGVGGAYFTSSATGTNSVVAGTGTACGVEFDGTFEVTGAGTVIPTQTLVTAAAAVLSVGSYIEFWRQGTIGDTAVTSVGPWD